MLTFIRCTRWLALLVVALTLGGNHRLPDDAALVARGSAALFACRGEGGVG
ncbi:hypothetical protein [Dickeya oryzae]